jgi:hypothetical protein
MMDGHDLKRLKTARHSLLTEIAEIEGVIATNKRLLTEKRGELEDIENKVKRATRNLVITEHAQLRYIERVMGVDLGEVNSKITPPGLIDKVQELGNGKFPIGDGARAVIRDNTIVTIEV